MSRIQLVSSVRTNKNVFNFRPLKNCVKVENHMISHVIIHYIVTLPKYGYGKLNIACPHITDILRYTH